MEPGKLLLLRHGESEWNRDNRCRLTDVREGEGAGVNHCAGSVAGWMSVCLPGER